MQPFFSSLRFFKILHFAISRHWVVVDGGHAGDVFRQLYRVYWALKTQGSSVKNAALRVRVCRV